MTRKQSTKRGLGGAHCAWNRRLGISFIPGVLGLPPSQFRPIFGSFMGPQVQEQVLFGVLGSVSIWLIVSNNRDPKALKEEPLDPYRDSTTFLQSLLDRSVRSVLQAHCSIVIDTQAYSLQFNVGRSLR